MGLGLGLGLERRVRGPGCCSHRRLARSHRREGWVCRPGYGCRPGRRCRLLHTEPVPRRRRLRMTIPVPRRRLCRLAILVPRYVRLAVWGPRRLPAVWHAIGVPRWLYHLAVPVPLRVGWLPRGVWRGLRGGGRVGGGRVATVCRLQRLCSLIPRHPPPPPPTLRRWRLLRRWRVHLRRPLPRGLVGACVVVVGPAIRAAHLAPVRRRRHRRHRRRGDRVERGEEGVRVRPDAVGCLAHVRRGMLGVGRVEAALPPPLRRFSLRRWRVHLRRPLPDCRIGALVVVVGPAIRAAHLAPVRDRCRGRCRCRCRCRCRGRPERGEEGGGVGGVAAGLQGGRHACPTCAPVHVSLCRVPALRRLVVRRVVRLVVRLVVGRSGRLVGGGGAGRIVVVAARIIPPPPPTLRLGLLHGL